MAQNPMFWGEKNSISVKNNNSASKELPQTEFHDGWDSLSNTWINFNTILYSYNLDGSIAQKILLNKNSKEVQKEEFQYNIIGNPTISTTFIKDTIANVWNQTFRKVIIYHKDKFVKEDRNELWNKTTNQWVLSSRNIKNYNQNDDITLNQIEQIVNNTTTITFGEETFFTYTNLNKKATEMLVKYNPNNNKWDSTVKINYTYNSSGSINFRISEIFDTKQHTWFNVHRQLYTYNNLDTLIQVSTFLFDRITETWLNNEIYDTINWNIWDGDVNHQENIASYIYKQWSNGDNVFEVKKSYTNNLLDAFGSSKITILAFNNNTFEPEQEFTKIFDNHLNKTYYQIRNGLNGQWQNFYEERNDYSYNTNNTLFEQIIWIFNFNLTKLEKQERLRFENFVTVGIHQNKPKEITAYPNPTTGLLKLDLPENTQAKINVINNLGVLQRTYYSQHNQIDLQDLANGIYFLKIEALDKVYTQRLIIQH